MEDIRGRAVLLGLGRIQALLQALTKHMCNEATDEKYLRMNPDKLFFFKHLYWSIIALQWCVSFCLITQ